MTALIDRYIRAALPALGRRFRDPLGREEGESLDPLRFTAAEFEHKRAIVGKSTWASVWMQDPRATGAGLFDRRLFYGQTKEERRILKQSEFDAKTEGLKWVRFYDPAYTPKQYNKPDPDFTVGTRCAARVDADNRITVFISDMVRYREAWGQVRENIRTQAELDGMPCRIGIEANGPQSGAAQDIRGDASLAGFVIEPFTEPLQPETLSACAHDGFLYLLEDLEGTWMPVFFDEAESYPNGSHDDTLKSATGGYIMAVRQALVFEPQSGSLKISKTNHNW